MSNIERIKEARRILNEVHQALESEETVQLLAQHHIVCRRYASLTARADQLLLEAQTPVEELDLTSYDKKRDKMSSDADKLALAVVRDINTPVPEVKDKILSLLIHWYYQGYSSHQRKVRV